MTALALRLNGEPVEVRLGATIADLVLAAVRDAWDSAVDLQQRQLGALGGSMGGLGGFGGPPAGFDLSSLGLPSFGQPGLAYDEDDEEEDDEDDLEDEADDADEDRPAGAPHDEPGRFRDLD